MFTLRCTKKLLTRLRVKPDLRPPASTTKLGDWYADVLNLGRERLVLCVSEMTLLPVVEFPVSPAIFEGELNNVLGSEHSYLDYRVVGAVAGAIEAHVGFLAVGASKEERLALHRCAMTMVIETMARADDSDADLACAFDVFETTYLDLAIDFLDKPFVLEDLIELAIWEDYGLVRRVETFFTTLPERHADAALRHLARVITELRREALEYHLDKATRLRCALLASIAALPNTATDEAG